jgi:probable blue pigment (indigoidine) exporter
MAGRSGELRDAGLFGVVALVWGLNYVFVRVGLTLEPPLWLATLRAGVGALVLLPWMLTGRRNRTLSTRDLRDALAIGVPNTGIFFGLWFVAASSVPPGETAVLVYTFPLWVSLLAAPLLAERPTASQLAAVALGFSGVVLVAEPWMAGPGALAPAPVLELLGGAAAWALGTVLFKRRFRGPTVFAANAGQLTGGAIGLLGASVVVGAPLATGGGAPAILVVAWLGVLGTALAYTIWFRLLDRFPASTLSGYTFLVPVVALTASFLVLGERLVLWQVAGVGAILTAIYLNARGSRAARDSEAAR